MKSNNPSEKSLVMSRAPSIKDIKSKSKVTADQRRAQEKENKLEGITFDDIQKMHYSNLNQGNKDDVFDPQDFLDLDSGDSDNEILSSFKQPPPPKQEMISL